MKGRINTGRISSKVRVRILRPWRGYPVGAEISPPAAMRQILLQAKDRMGKPVAEVVAESAAAAPQAKSQREPEGAEEKQHAATAAPAAAIPAERPKAAKRHAAEAEKASKRGRSSE